MNPSDHSNALIEAVRDAHARHAPLVIHGGNTKRFYGRVVDGEPLDVSPHCGVVSYEPTELVITARGGTLLRDIETLLAEHGQMLPFEPPCFGERATLGGCIAAGLSGPRRPYAGSVRDTLLGVEILNGKGEHLRFGGEVMKNVAGYDLSRLMAGSLGTLGLLLQASVKVLPKPVREITLVQALDPARAINVMATWAKRPLPISATWHDGRNLYARISGGEHAVNAATEAIGGDQISAGEALWQTVREQTAPFFHTKAPLWRLSVPPAAPVVDLPGNWAIEWDGALRWLQTSAPAEVVRGATVGIGGHATLFRGGDRKGELFHTLPSALMAIHKRLKAALDPAGVLNPGRLYPDL
jgi:glycolate oxidase FAD binding subunit